ncbi:MAG TPA: hypothetical protein VGB70_01435 [Allosphingosinicella sp.]|jgi:hypothetical protein
MNKIIKSLVLGALVLSPVAAVAKDKKKVTGLELQQVQAKDFETNKTTSFSAVMSVLQDEGYRIHAADKDTGLITAIASTESKTTWMPFVGFGKKKRTPIVSAFIEERGPGITRVRLNFVMSRFNASQYGSSEGERPITEPTVYQQAFEKIEKAIFLRIAMDAKPVAPADAQPAVISASQPVPATGGATPQ